MKKIAVFLALLSVKAMSQQLKTEIDKKEIKIGEQIQYKIEAKAKKGTLVAFPKGQTFMPLEMVEEMDIDTVVEKTNYRLVKKYSLTVFDQGNYTIPQQVVTLGKDKLYTPQMQIRVEDVPVDTLKQPLYPIKEYIQTSKPLQVEKYYMAVIAIALAAVAFTLWYIKRKKALTEEEKLALLPPFERAVKELENLKKSKYLIESKHKEYYSSLTEIVKRFLEDQIHINASESTTDELIEKVQTLLKNKKINLPESVVSDFRRVLKKADLVKFAKKQPEVQEAELDTKTMEEVVVKTKELMPEQEEEEKLKQEQYRREKENKIKEKRKKITAIAIAGFLISAVVLGGGYWMYYKKFVEGTSQEYLRKKEWVSSTYGFPPLKVRTPFTLERVQKMAAVEKADVRFSKGELEKGFSMDLCFYTLKEKQNFDRENTQEFVRQAMENVFEDIMVKYRTKNVIEQHDMYKSPSGKEGVKIYGSFQWEDKEGNKNRAMFKSYAFFTQVGYCAVNFYHPLKSKEKDEELIEKIMAFL